PYFSDQRPGDVRFVDQNQGGVIDEADKVMLGDPNPDFEAGIQLYFEYKGVYLNTTMAGKFGMQVMQSYRSFADNFDQNYTTQIFGRWHGAGTTYQRRRLSSGSNVKPDLLSDSYVECAAYLRITSLTGGFNLGPYIYNVKFIEPVK